MEIPAPFLRPLRGADVDDVLAAFLSSEDMARQGEVRTKSQAQEYVERLVRDGSSSRAFVIDVQGTAVGLVAVSVDEQNKSGWFWYWMHARWRGHGWVRTAAASVADWALSQGGCERLELGHRVNNPASGAVALAAGFVLEGRERGKFLIDGQRVDVLTYGRLIDDPAPPGARMPLRW